MMAAQQMELLLLLAAPLKSPAAETAVAHRHSPPLPPLPTAAVLHSAPAEELWKLMAA
jgi:hypothetical protein